MAAILYKYPMATNNNNNNGNPILRSLETSCCFLATLFPKVFCTLVLTWSLYVLLFIIPNYIKSSLNSTILNIIGITLYVLCIISYYKIILIGPGSPLDYPELRINDLNRMINENPYNNNNNDEEPGDLPPESMIIHTMKVNGNQGYRYCTKCSVWKPDRSHHCSSSGKCILKMDHYCPWFSTCIGFHNYKFFIQFLSYVAIYCWFLFIISGKILYNFITEGLFEDEILSLNLVAVLILSFAFAIAVSVFAMFLIYLCCKNLTTIEFQEKRWNYRGQANDERFNYEFDNNGKRMKININIFDLGIMENWKLVMGPNWITWILPITVTVTANTKSMISQDEFNNGVNFKVNEEIYAKYLHNAELQQQLNQQLSSYKDRLRRERQANIV